MPHILIVCTANICRSPVGEALLRDLLQKKGLDNWTVSSVGTWVQVERGAANNTIQLMAEQGFDLTTHRARMLEKRDLQEADLVLCMESGHVEALKAEFPAYGHKIYLLNEMIDRSYSIQDPYRQPIEVFRIMVEEIAEVFEKGLDRIIKLAEQNDGDLAINEG